MTDERTAAAVERPTHPVPPAEAPGTAAGSATPEPGPVAQAPVESPRPGEAAAEAVPPEPPPIAPADPATAAALADVLAARAALGDELIRLEASARAAIDVKAKVRRNPGKTAAVVGGTAFVVAGGPRRVLRAARRRVFGVPDPLPPSLLPDQVDKAVRALGDDGEKVRGALEREFAAFVDTKRKGESQFTRRVLLTAGVPLASEVSRMLLKRLFAGSAEDVADREAAIRARIEGKEPPPTR